MAIQKWWEFSSKSCTENKVVEIRLEKKKFLSLSQNAWHPSNPFTPNPCCQPSAAVYLGRSWLRPSRSGKLPWCGSPGQTMSNWGGKMFATLGIWRPVVATKVSIKLKVSRCFKHLSNIVQRFAWKKSVKFWLAFDASKWHAQCQQRHSIPTFPFIHFHSKIPYHMSTSQSPLVPHL